MRWLLAALLLQGCGLVWQPADLTYFRVSGPMKAGQPLALTARVYQLDGCNHEPRVTATVDEATKTVTVRGFHASEPGWAVCPGVVTAQEASSTFVVKGTGKYKVRGSLNLSLCGTELDYSHLSPPIERDCLRRSNATVDETQELDVGP